MKTRRNLFPGSLVVIAFAAVSSAHAGFDQTGAGPYDYNDTVNWVSGAIDSTWEFGLTLTAAQRATFAADTVLATGLTFNYAGNFALTLDAAAAGTNTITPGGDITLDTSGGTTANVLIGGTTNHLNVNLGGVTRTMSVAASRTLTLNDVVSNGSITKTGTGTLQLNGVNTLGDVAVNDGTLFTEKGMTFGNLSVASAKTFQFGAQDAAYTIQINGLSGAGTVTTAGSGGFQRNLTLGNNDATADFSGVITQASNHALVLTKTGIGTQTLSGSTANTQGGGTGVGFDTYVSAGSLVLNKTAAIALPGDVFINGGTLQLSGSGDNQIADTAAVNWSSGEFDLNGRSETVGALPVSILSTSANQINVAAGKTFTAAGNVNIFNSAATTLGTSVTFNSAGSVPTSTFAVTGASSFIFGQDSTTSSTTRTNTLDMRNLSVFNAGTSGAALTNFVIGNYVQAVGPNYGNGGINTAYLAPGSTIYATAFGVGKTGSGIPGQFNNTLYLGSGTTALHATTITVGQVGSTSTGSTVKWDSGVTSGSLTLNGTGATSAVTNMYVGYKTDTASASAGTRLGTVDLSNGTVTGTITNLYVGYKTTASDSGSSTATTTGVFKIGGGVAGASSNLTIGNLTLAHSVSTNSGRNNPVNGTFQLDGGNVSVTNNVVLTNESAYDQRNGTLTINGGGMTVGGNITSGITRATSTLTLSGGTLDMTSGNICTAANPIGTFNFYSGTLSNVGSIHAGTATVRTVTADNETITLTSPNTFSVGAGGFTLGADTGVTSSHKLTLTGTGSFAVKNAAANVVIGVAQANQAAWSNTATLDLSGLSSVVLGDATTAINELRVGFGQTANGSLLLSNTADTINANVVSVGHSSNGSNNSGAPSITLGTGTNLIAADTINLGLSKGNGTLKFASQTAGSPGTVTITDQAGTGGAAIVIGSNNGINTGITATGLLDLRGHVATVTADTVTLGYSTNTGVSSPTGTLSFDAGSFAATTLNMATLAAASGTSNVSGTLNIGGGAFTAGTLLVANKSAAGTGTATGNINVSGGSLTVDTAFTLASQATAGASAGTLTITGGGTVISNADILDGGGTSTSRITLNGGTLDMAGKNIGDATNSINTLEFQSGNLKNVAAINGIGGLTKTTAGTLTIQGTNTYAGATTVSLGTLALGAGGSLPAGSTVNLAAGTVFNTTAQAAFSMAATQAFNLTVDGAGVGSSGRIIADGLNISAAVVTFDVTGTLDDPAYVLATYTSGSLVGTAFGSVTPPSGYTINYTYNGGTQIALVASAASGYANWLTLHPGITDPAPGADPESDGIENVLEYVLNGNPMASDPSILPVLNLTSTSFVFTFKRLDDSETDTTQTFQYGSTLGAWTDVVIGAAPSGPDGNGVTVGVVENGSAPDSITVTVPKAANTKLFGRLQAIKLP